MCTIGGLKRMKRNLTVVVVLLWAATSVFSQTLTQADRDQALQYLESSRQGVLTATASLSEAQWNSKPAPDKWSVAEVVEHVAAAEDYLMGMLTSKVMPAPARPAADDVKAIDAMVLANVPDRSHKAQAPEPLKPTNRFGSPEGSLKHFTETRAQTEEFLKSHNDLRDHAIDSPMGKKLDAYEWILFVAAHSERHTQQINEVKSDPNFPKK
jgi:uncharacterized damage-inducible protein DinB